LKHYRHIIWDWNGTLVDDVRVSVEVLNQVLAKYGMPLTDCRKYRSQFGFPVQDYYNKLGFDFSKQSYRAVADDFIAAYNAKRFTCPLQDGARDVLQCCQDLGLTQSILSAYAQTLLEECVEFFGLRPFFVRLAGLADYFAAGKIAEGRRLVWELAVDPPSILLIGDTLHDHEVAQALGIDCILIGAGHQDPDRLRVCEVPLLDCVRQVPAFLDDDCRRQAQDPQGNK